MSNLEIKEVTVDDDVYSICLLNVRDALNVEAECINLFSAGQQGKLSGDRLYGLAKMLLNGAEVNNHPLNIDKHFARRVGHLNKVVFACIKENFPDFFGALSGSFMQNLAAKFGSANEQ